MKNSILSQALESLETPVDQALPEEKPAETVAPAKPAETMITRENTDEVIENKLEELTADKVVMNAPLSTIFTRALNIQLAKKSVVTGEYEGTTPAGKSQEEAVAVESQAQDLYYSAQARQLVSSRSEEARPGDKSEPHRSEVPESIDTGGSGTRLVAPATQQEVVKFFNSDQLDGAEPEFVFYRNAMSDSSGVLKRSHDEARMIMLNEKGGQVTYVVESIQVIVNTREVKILD